MSKKGGKDGGGSMDKEKELGKLYKELGALRCSPESHNTEYFQSKNLLSWNLCDRPTEDFDPEQEDWEKAVKVSVPQFLTLLLLPQFLAALAALCPPLRLIHSWL